MSQICAHCGSHIKIEEYDARTHTIIDYRCGMCGRNKFTEQKSEVRQEKEVRLKSESPEGAVCPLSSVLCSDNKEKNMSFHDKCSTSGCKSPAWGKSDTTGEGKCFKCLMAEIKSNGFAERLTELIAKHGGTPADLALVIPLDAKKIQRALNGQPTGIHNVLMAVKSVFGMRMKTWLRIGQTPYPDIKPAVAKAKTSRKTKLQGGLEKVPAQAHTLNDAGSSPAPAPTRHPFVYLFDSPEILHHGDAIVMGDDGKLHRASSSAFRSPLPSEEVYEMTDGFQRTAVLVFSFIDGVKTFAECRYTITNYDHNAGAIYDFDDWMFLGAIASEIRRIQEGGHK